jgi:phage baseplate assembly protein W
MSDRDRLFGSDLALTEAAGGLDLVRGGPGDLARASGPDTIAQALTLALRIRLGELAPLGWPDFGSRIHELIGEPNVRRTQVRLLAYARSAVARDPRVERIVDISCTPAGPDTVRLELLLQLVGATEPVAVNHVVGLAGP